MNFTSKKVPENGLKVSDILSDEVSGYNLKEYFDYLKKDDEVKFFVNKSKKTIVCKVLVSRVHCDTYCFAKVKLAEGDEWDEELGKALAYLKARGLLNAFRNSKTTYHGEEK